jgi:hypothetical protein
MSFLAYVQRDARIYETTDCEQKGASNIARTWNNEILVGTVVVKSLIESENRQNSGFSVLFGGCARVNTTLI